MKKCPPGVICIENVSLTFILIILFIVCYLLHCMIKKSHQHDNISSPNVIVNQQPNNINPNSILNYPYSNVVTKDVLMNPYSPPLKDERYAIPVNVSTNVGVVDTSYRQVGILTPLNDTPKDQILSLMGRPLYVNRDLWQYYTISNQRNNVKLPISVNGKSGSNEYGVSKLFSGDTVYVEGMNTPYKITIYDNDTIKYIPFV